MLDKIAIHLEEIHSQAFTCIERIVEHFHILTFKYISHIIKPIFRIFANNSDFFVLITI